MEVRRELWLTVSNAFDRSIDTATVRRGGLGSLKPAMTWWARGSRAVEVDRVWRKPCCVDESGREFSSGSMSRSRTLAAGQRREMGR